MRAICVSLNRQFPVGISIPLFFYVCVVLTPLHPLSGWGQNLLHFMVWNKILLCKWCILKSFFPLGTHVSWRVYMQETGLGSYLICFEGLCICLWHDSWCVLLNSFFPFEGSTRFTTGLKMNYLSPLFWHQDEALSSAWTRNTAKFASISLENYLKIVTRNSTCFYVNYYSAAI